MAKLWGGRFTKAVSSAVEHFTQSIQWDQRLYRQDIAGSMAHARMLARQGLLTPAEADAILAALEQLSSEIESGRRQFDPALEDIHTHIEHWLVEKVGSAGKKLHTGRSRNDQVALDLKLFVRHSCQAALDGIRRVQRSLLQHARDNSDVVMPGYTHLQRAMPILWAHYLLSFFEMLQRDAGRFADAARRADESPLGAAALAGSGLPLERSAVADELKFSATTANSLDTVSDRDFILEYLCAATILMLHLSRLAEDWILFSTSEFQFLELDESHCTGSSLMPHKKNPDVMELLRGKSAIQIGRLCGMLALVKGLPSGYNRDLQEDKAPLLETAETLGQVLSLLPEVIAGVRVNRQRMHDAASAQELMATDLAEYLVQRGLPFRDAHQVVGELVRHSLESGRRFSELSLEEWKKFSHLFEADVLQCLNPERSVDSKITSGSTGRRLVQRRLDELWKRFQDGDAST